MTVARTIQEEMFVIVGHRADGNWYPIALQGCLPLFTTAEAATTFLREVGGIPNGAKVSRESGWDRVIGCMRLARDEGATLVAVDCTATAKGVSLDESNKALENMLEQVALTATALLRRLLIACAAKTGTCEDGDTVDGNPRQSPEVMRKAARAPARGDNPQFPRCGVVPAPSSVTATSTVISSIRSIRRASSGLRQAVRIFPVFARVLCRHR